MSRSAGYRLYAAECLALAQQASSDADRRSLIEMAANWHALARFAAQSIDERDVHDGSAGLRQDASSAGPADDAW
jgi:hypothetical protein